MPATPPGQSPPFATWSDTDHSGAVIIVTTICMVYWLVAGAVQQTLSIGSGMIFSWAESLFGVSIVRLTNWLLYDSLSDLIHSFLH